MHAAHALALLVFLPATASQVAAHHRLHRDRLEALDQHRAPQHLAGFAGGDHALGQLAGEVVRTQVAELAEPEQCHLREQLALAGNGLAHDHVEGRQAVGGHHQDAVLADSVVVSHLPARKQGQGGQGGGVQGGGHGHPEKETARLATGRGIIARGALAGAEALAQWTTWARSPWAYFCATTCRLCPLILPAWPSQPNSR